MRARKNPGIAISGRKLEVAQAYGLTVAELGNEMYQFLQNEGYDEDGNEYHNLHDWLTM